MHGLVVLDAIQHRKISAVAGGAERAAHPRHGIDRVAILAGALITLEQSFRGDVQYFGIGVAGVVQALRHVAQRRPATLEHAIDVHLLGLVERGEGVHASQHDHGAERQ